MQIFAYFLYKRNKQKTVCWGWGQQADGVDQKFPNLSLLWRYQRKNQIQTFQEFPIESRRLSASLEGFNSSLTLVIFNTCMQK